MISAGPHLRNLREKLGLTMRDIETGSERLARKYSNEEYFIPISRLSDFETKGVIPSIYRFYSLAVIYHKDMRELLAFYGVDMKIPVSDLQLSSPPKSHLSDALAETVTVEPETVAPLAGAVTETAGAVVSPAGGGAPPAVQKSP